MTPALVAHPLLIDVVTRAGHRCQCTRRGCHGRSERCQRTMPNSRLVAGPADVAIPMHAAWRVPADELIARCARCHDAAQSEGRHQREARRYVAALAQVLPIPGLPDDPPNEEENDR